MIVFVRGGVGIVGWLVVECFAMRGEHASRCTRIGDLGPQLGRTGGLL
jgi:hypothetical protein